MQQGIKMCNSYSGSEEADRIRTDDVNWPLKLRSVLSSQRNLSV
jgi:hypothetical protein